MDVSILNWFMVEKLHFVWLNKAYYIISKMRQNTYLMVGRYRRGDRKTVYETCTELIKLACKRGGLCAAVGANGLP